MAGGSVAERYDAHQPAEEPERRSITFLVLSYQVLLKVTRVLTSTRLTRLGALSVPCLEKHVVRARGIMPSVYHGQPDRKSTRLNSSHLGISYAVFCVQTKIMSE